VKSRSKRSATSVSSANAIFNTNHQQRS
jgi:hypothetical protein